VVVVDGYGVNVTASRGHLFISDGLGRQRRQRRLSRAQRAVTRIVILGHAGHLTLEAVRWCADVGIALVQLDTDGRALLTAGPPSKDDARIRKATSSRSQL
jgi:CRISPR-associated protein Cas1